MDGMGRLEHGENGRRAGGRDSDGGSPANARNPAGGHGGREEEGVVWRGQGTAEHMSKSDKKDADEVR